MVDPAPEADAEEELQLQRLLFDPVAEWLLFDGEAPASMTTQQLDISDAISPPPPPLPLAPPSPSPSPSPSEDHQGERSSSSSSSDDQGDAASTSTSTCSARSIPQAQGQLGHLSIHSHSHSDDDKDLDEDEDDDESAGTSTNHTTDKDLLPPVPPILVHLQPHHQTLPIGHILSILGNRIIVEGSVHHNPLNEGSILWLTHTRTPLGLIDETFGPVKTPFYAIRYNSPHDLPPAISVGTPVSFVPEFATFVLSANNDVYQKGYDIADDEIADDLQFSDDEKEAEYKRSIRQAKRAAKNTKRKQPAPLKNRTNVKNDCNSPSHSQLPHPIAHSQQNQQGQFSQNQLPPNQFQPNQLPQNQFQHNQFAQNQFPLAHMPQYQLPQSQMLQNQLLFNLSMLATGMQIPSLGLAMNTNQSPFMSGGINFPPSAMQFNPGNMQLNPGIFASGGARPPMQGNLSIQSIQFNPANASSSGEQPVAPMQFHPGNVSTGGQGQFSPGQSFPFPLPIAGEGTNLQFSPGILSNRGERPNQRGRGGRHFAGRNGNVRP